MVAYKATASRNVTALKALAAGTATSAVNERSTNAIRRGSVAAANATTSVATAVTGGSLLQNVTTELSGLSSDLSGITTVLEPSTSTATASITSPGASSEPASSAATADSSMATTVVAPQVSEATINALDQRIAMIDDMASTLYNAQQNMLTLFGISADYRSADTPTLTTEAPVVQQAVSTSTSNAGSGAAASGTGQAASDALIIDTTTLDAATLQNLVDELNVADTNSARPSTLTTLGISLGDAQRITLDYGNGSSTTYSFDATTSPYNNIVDADAANVTIMDADNSTFVTGGANLAVLDYNGAGTSFMEIDDGATVGLIWGGVNSDDTVVVRAGATVTTVNIEDGNDSVTFEGNAGSVLLGTGDDTLNVAGIAGAIDGGSGNDTVTIGGDSGAVTLGTGMDSLTVGGNVAGVISAGDDADTITVGGNATNIYGETGDDTITVDGDAVLIDGGTGNDTITLGGGGLVDGGSGNDTLTAGHGGGVVQIFGGDDNDTIIYDVTSVSSLAGDFIHGGNGSDTLELRFSGDSPAGLQASVENELALGESLGFTAGTLTGLNLYVDTIETINIVRADGTVRTFNI